MSRRVSGKEMEFINAHKQAVEEGDTLDKKNGELEEALRSADEELKELHREYDDMQEDRSCQYIILREQIEKVKAEITEYEKKKASREQYYENLKNMQGEFVGKNTEQFIREKAVVVGSVKSILEAKVRMAKDTKTLRATQRIAEAQQYKDMAQTNVQNFETEKALLVGKYTKLIEGQKKEKEKYGELFKEFRNSKKYAGDLQQVGRRRRS